MLRRTTQSSTHFLTQFLKFMHSNEKTPIHKNIDEYLCELEAKHLLKWQGIERWSNLIDTDSNANEKISEIRSKFTQKMMLVTKAVLNDWRKLQSSSILDLDIRRVNELQISSLINTALSECNIKDFLYLIDECVKHEKLPTNRILQDSLRYLGELGALKDIEALASICHRDTMSRREFMRDNANFEPYMAMALWQKDSNWKALDLLSKSYIRNQMEPNKSEQSLILIRNVFRLIIAAGISKKSEATMISAIKIATDLYRDYKDIFMLACIWKECFTSEWFSDQQTSLQLFKDYEELREMVARRSSHLCSWLLNTHRMDAVYRLIQLLLQNNFMEDSYNCLYIFFDYQYKESNLRGCLEIVRTCHELNAPLDEKRSKQFMNLLLRNNSWREKSEISVKPKVVKNSTDMEFRYKF